MESTIAHAIGVRVTPYLAHAEVGRHPPAAHAHETTCGAEQPTPASLVHGRCCFGAAGQTFKQGLHGIGGLPWRGNRG
jgi:hypothetical protein